MKIRSIIRVCGVASSFIFLAAPPAPAAFGAEGGTPYTLNAGDMVEIAVWKEEALQRVTHLSPDGTISFPLIGTLDAENKTIEQVREEITRRLHKYVPDPVVTVGLKDASGNRIYVIGKVFKPGEFVASRFVDVIQALAMAGGVTPYASVNNISILRRSKGKQSAIPFRYSDIEKGKNLPQNIVLRAGDIVIVP